MTKQGENLLIGGNYTATGLGGNVGSMSGCVEPKFVKAIEKLMLKYKVNYVQLYWSKFK